MKPALYVLAGVAAMFAFAGGVILSVELTKWLFGEVWGFGIWGLTLMALGGGYTGWTVYRLRGGKRP